MDAERCTEHGMVQWIPVVCKRGRVLKTHKCFESVGRNRLLTAKFVLTNKAQDVVVVLAPLQCQGYGIP